MSELHKFLFEGLPVRGMLVRLTDGWREILSRREAVGAWAPPVQRMMGEMVAASTLMQANLKFDGALVLQVQGDGPVRLAVAECHSDLRFRATAKVEGEVPDDATLAALVNAHGRGRCAITLDPEDREPGQQPYQGVVGLATQDGQPVADVATMLEQYMRQSEQLETRLVLACNDEVAAGLLIQRMPIEGVNNLEGRTEQHVADEHEAFERIAHLASTLKADELLSLDVQTVLHRLFWEEQVRLFEPQAPRFSCSCSADRVRNMLLGLGRDEADSIIAERGEIEVACDFCGQHYRFDAVDVGEMFAPKASQAPSATGGRVH